MCRDMCVPLLGKEGEDWFQEVKACPYQGLHFDIMSPKIAKKVGLKVEPIKGKWEFVDALGTRVRITGTGLA